MKILDVLPTGSRVICNPAPMHTDEDILILVEGGLDDADTAMTLALMGFTTRHNRFYAFNGERKPFMSWRRGDLNLLVTTDPKYFNLFWVATDLAKRLNLLDKPDRIALFQAILYGEGYPIHTLEDPNG